MTAALPGYFTYSWKFMTKCISPFLAEDLFGNVTRTLPSKTCAKTVEHFGKISQDFMKYPGLKNNSNFSLNNTF